jgi:gentisate 1,2-dioxygenase
MGGSAGAVHPPEKERDDPYILVTKVTIIPANKSLEETMDAAAAIAERSDSKKAKTYEGSKDPKRAAFYEKISQRDMTPLWEVLKGLVTKEPKTACVPAIWHFDEVKPLVEEAGGLLTAQEAERRVLVLENPAMRGQSKITNSLYAGLQLILPGEIAGAHRHTASAIRLILDGEGAYTQVDGEKTVMKYGDFVLTPNWTAHDHGNESKVPMIWLDVLDIPTVNFFETAFSEHLDNAVQNTARVDNDSLWRFGSGVLPDGTDTSMLRSPVINYAYERVRPILDRMKRTGEPDKHHGFRLRYAHPFTGGWSSPTMGAHLSLLPAGFKSEQYRSTDGTIFVCLEGKGTTKIGNETVEWGPRDVFVVPTWAPYSHVVKGETVLFSISDRPAQEALGIWRELN